MKTKFRYHVWTHDALGLVEIDRGYTWANSLRSAVRLIFTRGINPKAKQAHAAALDEAERYLNAGLVRFEKKAKEDITN